MRASSCSTALRAILLLAPFAAFGQTDQHVTLPVGSPAPDFALPGVDGRTHKLIDYAAVLPGAVQASQGYNQPVLKDLRKNGPHPKNLVAAKLGVSIAGLARNGIEDALTTEQVDQLIGEKPEWLAAERESYQTVLHEQRRLKALRADKDRGN